MSEKRIRQESERKLQEEWGILVQEKNNLEEQKRNLEHREAKLSEVIDLIPSAKELKSMGVEFTYAIAWINTIREYASKKMIDERSATWRLAEDLKSWLELGGLESAIENATHQLSLLNVALEDQKLAIATMVDLRKSGMTEDEIADLTRVVSEWSGKTQNNGSRSSFKLDTDIILPKT
jgi:hypothetical protein